MTLRDTFRSPALKGLAASLSFGLMAAVVGCDATTNTDKAVATVNEPVANNSSAGTSTAAAPAPSSEKAADKPAAAPATASGWGTLKGRVIFGGDPPAPKVLVAKGDKSVKDGEYCSKSEIDSQRLVVNKSNKGVQYALVYIPKPTAVNPEAASATKTHEIVFDQKNCTFVPHVLAGMRGETVMIKSSDSVGHNTNAVGLINNKFNLPTQPNSGQPLVLKGPDKPGKVGCDIHPWMEAYWLVQDNPYFAVTDADGNFEIKNAPAGDQKVVVWAEALGPGYLTPGSGEVVNIKAGGETTKDWTLDPAKVK
jgi:hypothetical protein